MERKIYQNEKIESPRWFAQHVISMEKHSFSGYSNNRVCLFFSLLGISKWHNEWQNPLTCTISHDKNSIGVIAVDIVIVDGGGDGGGGGCNDGYDDADDGDSWI